jgi:hypothetical protein
MAGSASFQLGYQSALRDIARALAQSGERGVREWLASNMHDQDIGDPFPLVEETRDPATELPTVKEWLDAGAPMREIEEEGK